MILFMNGTQVIQDYGFTMATDINADDHGSLGWFNGFLTMKNITSNPSTIKKSGMFELHDQFYMNVGTQFLLNGFQTFVEESDVNVSSHSFEVCEKLVFGFIEHFGIKLFIDLECDAKEGFDDLMNYARDVCGRTILSLIFDKMEEEADSLGLRGLRIIMISYFLARKEKQDSKYAASLLGDLVREHSASPRTRKRMENLVCVKPSRNLGEALARDKRNEHEILRAKEELKGLHGALKDSLVEKCITGQNAIHLILDHDRASMLHSTSSKSSYDYMGDDKRQIVKEELDKVKPFDRNRAKVEFKEKSAGSVFNCDYISKENLERFVLRNKKMFAKECTSKK